MAKSKSPTSRTLAVLRDRGAVAQVVEHWNPFARRRIDLFGVIDIVAVQDDAIVGIQCTTGGNLAARQAKALDEPRLRSWLEAGGRFECWGWRRIGARHKRKSWHPLVREARVVDGAIQWRER